MNISAEEEQFCFQLEHANAIQHWANVEEALASLVSDHWPKVSRAGLYVAFYGIDSFRSKLEFADRLLHAMINGDEKLWDEWSKLRKKVDKLSAKRNKLAHWTKATYEREKAGRRVVLEMPVRSPRAPRQAPEALSAPIDALGVRELVEIRFQFFGVTGELWNFQEHLVGNPSVVTSDVPTSFTLEKILADCRMFCGFPQRPIKRDGGN